MKSLLIFLLAALIISALGLQIFCVYHDPYVGMPDEANSAVLAKNFSEGRGFVVDYLWHFYLDYPKITHPEDGWPLLQPLITAPFYLIFNKTLFGIKFATVFLFILLIITTYSIGKYYFDRITALIACSLVLGSGLFNFSFYPFNDIGFCLFGLIAFWTAAVALEKQNSKPWYILCGIFSGLVLLQKHYGLVVVFCIATVIIYRNFKRDGFLKTLLYFFIPLLLTISPYLLRNYLLFKDPYFSACNKIAAGILGYADYEQIYRIWYLQPSRFLSLVFQHGSHKIFLKISAGLINTMRGIYYGEIINNFTLILAVFGLAFFGGLKKFKDFFIINALWFFVAAGFLAIYWRYEARYLYMSIPFVSLLAAHSITSIYNRLNKRHLLTRLLFVLVAGFYLVTPISIIIKNYLKLSSQPFAFGQMCSWVKENTPEESIVMTREPWELNFYTGRKSVMVPYGEMKDFYYIAKKYNVKYLQVEKTVGERNYLGQLYNGLSQEGFIKVYEDKKNNIYIFELSVKP